MRMSRAIAAAAIAMLALVAASDLTPAPATDYVNTYNDGFMAAKEDDCDQGFQPACTWLANNR